MIILDMDTSILYIGISGAVIGTVASVILNVYSKTTASKYTYFLFGMNVSDLLTYIMILSIGFGVALLSGFSVLIRDLQYPKERPWNFTIETLIMALVPSAIIFIMTDFRGHQISNETWVEYIGLCIKFGLLHILFQFSGVYTSILPYIANTK
jgi:hypothetical protein